jgi:rhomboid protease GluP
MWGFAGPLRAAFRGRSFTDVVTVACVLLYVASLLVDPTAALRPRGLFEIFAPSNQALWTLGATGAIPWRLDRWWTLLTAIYLHGGLLHILFNLLWIRQLGPAVEDLYGSARFVVIFTVSGVLGFLVSNTVGVAFTIGASGSIFGLLGAIVAFGQRRGGAFGSAVLRQYGMWAVILFLFGLFMPGVNNYAHAGGFVGGAIAGYLFSSAERRAERGLDQILAAAAGVATVLAFGFAIQAAFLGS